MLKIRPWGKGFPSLVVLVTALLILVWADASAQQSAPSKDSILRKEGYILPPKAIADAVVGSRPDDNVVLNNMSPDGKKFLVAKKDGMPTVDRMGRPCVHLAELAFDHTAHRAHQLYVDSNAGYELYYYAERRKVPVEVPDKMRVSNPAWSPDGSQLAFYAHSLDATHIYIADATTGKSRQLTQTPVLATMVTTFHWSRDGKRIQTVLLPDDGTRKSNYGDVAAGPKLRVGDSGKNPSRTYRYLLETEQDMELLEHLLTGQLAVIEVASGKVSRIGQPSMLKTVSMSPGAEGFRVATMKKPFSYYAPATNFGSQDGLWDQEGKNVYSFSDGKKGKGGKGKGKMDDQDVQPPADPDKKQPDPPPDPDAKRDLAWRPDGAGMSYLQLEPAKKDSKDARKDRVMQWLPPYGARDVKLVYETPNPITSVQYSDDCQMLFLTRTVDKQRQIVAVDLERSEASALRDSKRHRPGRWGRRRRI